MSVRWVWAGNVSDTGFTVTAGIDSGTRARLAVSTDSGMTNPVYGDTERLDGDGYVRLDITGLTPATQYWYQLEVDDSLDARTGKCKTFPTSGEPSTFSFAFASCADTASTTRSYAGIASSGVDFFLHLGDRHYEDIATNDTSLFQQAHELNFAVANQLLFQEAQAIGYTWSDHDYGPNNSDATATGRDASCQVYRQIVPHWELADDHGIWQKFQVGRVLFIILDERSYRDPNLFDIPNKTMLGEAQVQWLENVCDEVASDDGIAAIVVASDQQMNMTAARNDEHWGRYTQEQERVGDILSNAGVPVVWLQGDEHASGFARSQPIGKCIMTILQHGSIASSDPIAIFGATSNRGYRQWDWGRVHYKGYGRVDIADYGYKISLTFTDNSVDQTTGAVTQPFTTTFKLPSTGYFSRRSRV